MSAESATAEDQTVETQDAAAGGESMSAEWAHLIELATADDGQMYEDSGDKSKSNILPLWGNVKTMNLNNVILQNILASPYFKNYLFNLKTYHEVVDEMYSQVSHLEPWEKGSRKTTGQVGMCGGVRGVGAGGIVSSAYCLLFKLFTLHLTRRQLQGLFNNRDSVYIRGLGFMYARYCLQPQDLWEWYEPYIDDEEELDVKAGGGHSMTVGELLRHFLTKLDWYSTLFPRIPIPIQKRILEQLEEHDRQYQEEGEGEEAEPQPPPRTVPEPVPEPPKPAERPREPPAPPASYGQMLSKELERHNRLEPEESGRKGRRSRSRSGSRSRGRSSWRDDKRDEKRRRSPRGRDTSDDRRRRRSHSRSRSPRSRRSRDRSRSPDRRRRLPRDRSDSRHRKSNERDYDRRRVTFEPSERNREDEEKRAVNEEEDEDYGHVERVLRRAAARKAAVNKDTLEDDLGLGLNTVSSRKGRPGVFI